MHSSAPFYWPQEDEFVDEELDCVTPKRPASVPEHKYKHDKFNELYREKLWQIHQQAKLNKQRSKQNGVSDLSLPLKEMGLGDDRVLETPVLDKECQTTERLYGSKTNHHNAAINSTKYSKHTNKATQITGNLILLTFTALDQ